MEKSLEQVAGDAQGVATSLREILKKHTALTDQAIATVERDTEIQRLKTDLVGLTDRLTKSNTSNTQLAQQLAAASETIAQKERDLGHAIDKQNLLQSHLDTAKTTATVKEAVESKDREATVVANTRRQCREDNDATIRVILEERDKLRGERDCKAAELKQALASLEDLKRASKCAASIGIASEKNILEFLQQVFAGCLHVRHVGQIGQGHLLDLELTTNDDAIRIHIDCKDYSTTFLPEGQIEKFNKDVDGLDNKDGGVKAHAAILFMRPHLRGANHSVQRFRRGSVQVFHVGLWDRAALIECIHEAIVQHKIEQELGEVHRRPFNGAPQVSAAFDGLFDLVTFLHGKVAAVATAMKGCALGATKYRIAAERIAAAHSVNLHAVPKTILDKFMSKLPKRNKGRPTTKETGPAAKRKRGANTGATPVETTIEDLANEEDELAELEAPSPTPSTPDPTPTPIPTHGPTTKPTWGHNTN
jgi:hypothetical protein